MQDGVYGDLRELCERRVLCTALFERFVGMERLIVLAACKTLALQAASQLWS